MEELIRSIIAGAAGVTILPAAGDRPIPLASVPDGVNLVSLERYLDNPARIEGVADLYRVADFTAYVNAYKQAGSRIFVVPDMQMQEGGTLAHAVLDYPVAGTPSWSTHQANLIVAPSMEYRMLTKLEGRGLIAQPDFALALRDVSRFCTTLSAADLVEIAQTLTLQSKGDFASIEDNFTGSVRFGYDVQVTAKSDATTRKNVEVPREIGFNLPVLLGGENVDITAELLYRVPVSKEDKVKMGIRIPDRRFVERAVLEATADALGRATSLVVAMGNSSVPRAPGE